MSILVLNRRKGEAHGTALQHRSYYAITYFLKVSRADLVSLRANRGPRGVPRRDPIHVLLAVAFVAAWQRLRHSHLRSAR